MNKTLKLGITLLIISAVAAAILAFSNGATKDKIAEIELKNTQDALAGIYGVVEDYDSVEGAELEGLQEVDEGLTAVYAIKEAGEIAGHSITTVTNGFGGPVEIMVGFSGDGEVLGVRVLKHGETAGIGSKAAEPEFTDTFEGKSADTEIEVETISGATITSSAVIKGVNQAREVYQAVLAN